MTGLETTSWIFLATAIASKSGPADFSSISGIADGINHAVPTHKELQSSLTSLKMMGLVSNNGSKYRLTEKGKIDYEMASRETSNLFKVWENIEQMLKAKYRL
jgi:predicted transcriptional regulator